MQRPVKISAELLEAAKKVAEPSHRSLAKQIEHWAELGRAVEHLVPTPEQIALKAPLARPTDAAAVAESRAALEKLVARLAAGGEREAAIRRIRETGGPVYGAGEGEDRVVQVWPDGRRVMGRFAAGGEFVAEARRPRPRSKPAGWRSKKR